MYLELNRNCHAENPLGAQQRSEFESNTNGTDD
jgi:hypothetical protein